MKRWLGIAGVVASLGALLFLPRSGTGPAAVTLASAVGGDERPRAESPGDQGERALVPVSGQAKVKGRALATRRRI